MQKSKKAMVAGHICLDIVPTIDQIIDKSLNEILTPGTLTTVKDVDFAIGGATYNVGETMQRLGVDTQISCVVGDDYFGEIIEKIIDDATVGKMMAKDDKLMTSFSIVLSVAGCDRVFLHAPGANDDFSIEHIDFEKVKAVDLFHFGYPPVMRNIYADGGKTMAAIYKEAKKYGVTTSLDMAMPDPNSKSGQVDWGEWLKNVLPYVDIFEPSIEEILYMIDRTKYDALKDSASGDDMIHVLNTDILGEIADKLHALGAKMVLLKCGEKGCFASTKEINDDFGKACPKDMKNWTNRKIHEQCFKVEKVVSTTGAGDATIAGFLSSLLSECSLEEALFNATAVGAACVSTIDVVSGMRTLEIMNAQAKTWGKR